VAHYITVGFNDTMRHLQKLTQPAPVASATGSSNEADLEMDMATTFVCTSTLPRLLISIIPPYLAAAFVRQPSRTQIRFVSLHAEAESLLANTLSQSRVGCVGLLEDAPGAKELVDLTRNIASSVDVSSLGKYTQVEYKSVCIKTTTSLSKSW
jgi:RNase P subunit Pop3